VAQKGTFILLKAMATVHFGRRKSAKSQFSVSVGGEKRREKNRVECATPLWRLFGAVSGAMFFGTGCGISAMKAQFLSLNMQTEIL
jgi:hypothetical protein